MFVHRSTFQYRDPPDLPGASNRYRLRATSVVPATAVAVQYELPDHFWRSLRAVSGEKILITR